MATPLDATAGPDGPADGDAHQYVAFEAGGERYALALAPVQEIIRLPEVVPVPLAPPALEGLANLRGRVLPLVSLRRLCGLPDREADDATRALVVDAGQPVGLIVDRVTSVLAVEPSRIEPLGAHATTIDTELLAGVIRDDDGRSLVLILDVDRLVAREFRALGADAAQLRAAARLEGGATGAGAETTDEDADQTDEQRLVSFVVEAQEYAVAIDHVREIVQPPPRLVPVPNAAAHVLGLMLLRERLLPLVSLRHLLGLPVRADETAGRVVVVGHGDQVVGLVADRVDEVLRVPAAAIDGMPSVIDRRGALADVTALCRLDEGKRLVAVLDVGALVRLPDTASPADAMPTELTADTTDAADDTTRDTDDEQVVVLRLGAQEFGVPIEHVQEIVRVPETLTAVPQAPSFVEGVMNLRGTVLPVIDLRRRLGLPDAARTDAHRVLVLVLDGVRTGFVVDAVAEVLKVPTRSIGPAPRLSATQDALLGRIANLEASGRIVQLIAPRLLVGDDALADVAALAA